jgi:hypothetical protein
MDRKIIRQMFNYTDFTICIGKHYQINVRWFPCHHSMVRPQVADGGDGLETWRIPAKILKKQLRTADKV